MSADENSASRQGGDLQPRQGGDSDPVSAAARWLVEFWHVAPQPITRTLRETFGLGFVEACKAMAEAKRLAGRG